MNNMNNKKGISGPAIALVVIGALLLISVLSVIGTYNSLVNSDVGVENQWGKVQSAYERRLDLIPNLVATVKGSAKFEQDTQTQVAALRSGIQTARNPSEIESVGKQVDSLVSGIMINVEAYPDLKSTQNFLALQSQLEGTENRIKWERDTFNDAVKDYKLRVRTFPSNMFAGMFGFNADKWNMFEAKAGAENAPKVDFS